jgi:uncharacterized OsmC-like protein
VMRDDSEQISEAMASPEVFWVVTTTSGSGGGVSMLGETSAGSANPVGTPMVLLQCGQASCVPASVVSHKTFWLQIGHENLNSLMGLR